jgi:hypothetical protein
VAHHRVYRDPLFPREPEAGPALNLEIAVTVLGLTVRRDASGNDVIVHKGKEYPLPDYSGDDAMALRVLNVLWKRGYSISLGGTDASPLLERRHAEISYFGVGRSLASGPTLALAICRCARRAPAIPPAP